MAIVLYCLLLSSWDKISHCIFNTMFHLSLVFYDKDLIVWQKMSIQYFPSFCVFLIIILHYLNNFRFTHTFYTNLIIFPQSQSLQNKPTDPFNTFMKKSIQTIHPLHQFLHPRPWFSLTESPLYHTILLFIIESSIMTLIQPDYITHFQLHG